MADYDIAAVTRRAVYSGSAGTGPYAFSFACLETSDIAVYKDTTLLTETSDYTVTLSSSTGTGSITLAVAANSGNTITLVGARDLARTTDFVTAGSLTASALNTDFDSLVIFAQQLSEENSRNLKAPVTEGISGTTDMTIPPKATRASKILEFDSDGNPAVSLTATGLSTIAGITGNITTVAGIAANVTTVAGISANVTTCAGKSSEITSVAAKASLLTADFVSDLNTLATSAIITDLDILGTADVVADLALLATSDIVSDLNTLATSDIVSDLNTLATSDIVTDLNILGTADNVTNMATLGASGVVANIATVAGISANTTTVAGIASDVTTVAGISANTTTVAGIDSNVTTVAGISGNVTTVAGVAANVTTVAGVSANVTTVATNIANVNTTATNIAGVNSFAERYRVGSSDPSSSLDEGDLFYNSTDNQVKYYNGSAWASITAGIGNVVEDTTPQLGGDLDLNSNDITGTGNLNFTGSITLTGNVDGRDVSTDGTKLDGIATSATANPNAIDNVVEDTTPQLGGTLDANGNTIDMDGNELILDADADTSITADTDDRIDLRVGGADVAYITNNTIGGIINRQNAKPLIINGDMAVDQRNAGASVTAVNNAYQVDRWRTFSGAASKFTVQQQTSVVPPFFRNAQKIVSSSAYSAAAGEAFALNTPIEGGSIASLGFGTANAKYVTLSFLVYSSLTGTFSGSLFNSAFNRSYPFTYSVGSANTWTTIVVAIPGDTSGTWLTTTGTGLVVNFDIGSGSNWKGSANAWASAAYTGVAGSVSIVGTSGATFYVTGVQLEVGEYDATTMPPFQHESYGDNLMRCYRYCQSTFSQGTAIGSATAVGVIITCATGTAVGRVATGHQFPVSMRAAPTIVIHNQTGGTTGSGRNGDTGGLITMSAGNASTDAAHFENSGVMGNDGAQLQFQFSATSEL